MNCTVCPDSSAGPGEIVLAKLATTCGPASSFTVSFAEIRNDGASFTEFTVMLTSASSESSALALTFELERVQPIEVRCRGVLHRLGAGVRRRVRATGRAEIRERAMARVLGD